MNATRLLLATVLSVAAAMPSEAQRLAPLAPVAYNAAHELDVAAATVVERVDAPLAVRAAPRDTLPARRELSRTGAMIGGIGGAVVGAFAGVAIGAGSAEGCHGEDCGLVQAVLGFALGESLGLAVGTHLGSRSTEHSNIILTTLTSTAILVGGTFIGAGMQQAGVVMVPLTPVMQLAAAWAIESH
jgi:hypothetical protein